MGKGDLKTRRGKIFRGTYGKLRPKKGGRGSSVTKPTVNETIKDMMQVIKITNKKTGESYTIFKQPEDFTTKEPEKYYRDISITKHLILSGVPDDEILGTKKVTAAGKEVFIEGMVLWNKLVAKIRSKPIPENLTTLLTTSKKSDQEKLIKGTVFTPDLIAALIFEACNKHGFTLRHIRHDNPQKGLDESKMPAVVEVKDKGEVKVVGKTEMSNGQLKQAVQHRKVTLGKFVEKGDQWHCFITNYKSLRGEETWLGAKQPHYHYISSEFGITKEEVIKQLRSDAYKLGNLPHIKLIDYGKQPDG